MRSSPPQSTEAAKGIRNKRWDFHIFEKASVRTRAGLRRAARGEFSNPLGNGMRVRLLDVFPGCTCGARSISGSAPGLPREASASSSLLAAPRARRGVEARGDQARGSRGSRESGSRSAPTLQALKW